MELELRVEGALLRDRVAIWADAITLVGTSPEVDAVPEVRDPVLEAALWLEPGLPLRHATLPGGVYARQPRGPGCTADDRRSRHGLTPHGVRGPASGSESANAFSSLTCPKNKTFENEAFAWHRLGKM